ncbi:MAG TPA: bifunctional YncE family protein/alkaline phosphatase family protein [Candidatus Bathyarchaeia archaeon]|nr:bifunctional YncE family protein/alkaline phosphatase family protein [Candidatus Bathyarchaeia archaeon]
MNWTLRKLSTGLMAALLLALLTPATFAQWNQSNWGLVTSSVYGTSETGAYAGAELFAGPNKFYNQYFAGVVPNGSRVTPAGTTVQIGMNPLGAVLTPDGKYLITSNDDEREGGLPSFVNSTNSGGYSLSVINASTMQVLSQITVSGQKYFVGMQATGTGPYTVWVSGGGDNNIKLFSVTTAGAISYTSAITISPILPSASGYVSNYSTQSFTGPSPSGFSTGGAKTTFPAGSALSPDGKYLYVACNGDNSLAVIDTTLQTVVKQLSVGYFPYSVSVSQDGNTVLVSNWGVTEYKFANPNYVNGKLASLGTTGSNAPQGYFVPVTSSSGSNPQTSSVSVLTQQNGNPSTLTLQGSTFLGHILDADLNIGDTHPSANVLVRGNGQELLYITKTNNDSVAIVDLQGNKKGEIDLSLFPNVSGLDHEIHGTYPNAIAVSSNGKRVYVAEAGINSVAVLDTTNPLSPSFMGRIPTDWYPTGLVVSSDGNSLYVLNAKGIGEDINPNTNINNRPQGAPPPTGVVSTPSTDSNYIFGTAQKIDLTKTSPNNITVANNNYRIQKSYPASPIPVGGGPSSQIKTVIFIEQENKTFDSMLGNLASHFGNYSGLYYNNVDGSYYINGQYTGVSLNTQALAQTFAAAVNYYSLSEESDAGHQFCSSGTASDYTEKTLLVKTGRGLLVNKNFEPEDYPENGYIFNNAARNGVSFKNYGELVRIEGTDTGTSTPTTLNDPLSGNVGYPQLKADLFNITNPLVNAGDVTTATQGLGQSYFMTLPILAILGQNNSNGEPRLDVNYPGYNFNISDQRRAQEFINDFDRMVQNGTLPQFLYIYVPNDHTGGVQAPNKGSVIQSGNNQYGNSASNVQQVADGDVAIGMIVQHIMNSPVYYNSQKNTGAAIFMTYDDAQSTLDHIHPHRTPLIVVSPFAKPGYLAKKHYSTASIVKTEELLLGLPPNNLGDLLATDLRDMFQTSYNGISSSHVKFDFKIHYVPSPEGVKIWSLVSQLDTSAPDRDSIRLGNLGRLSQAADNLHKKAAKQGRLNAKSYQKEQAELYEQALRLVHSPVPAQHDADGD